MDQTLDDCGERSSIFHGLSWVWETQTELVVCRSFVRIVSPDMTLDCLLIRGVDDTLRLLGRTTSSSHRRGGVGNKTHSSPQLGSSILLTDGMRKTKYLIVITGSSGNLLIPLSTKNRIKRREEKSLPRWIIKRSRKQSLLLGGRKRVLG